jgi:uncharacterized membrane protein
MEFSSLMEGISRVFEVAGVGIISLGGLYALASSAFSREPGQSFFEQARRLLAQPLLLGLEVLVAADIILTITVDLSLESVATLGVLVLIRVVLSFSLDIETAGMLPWRRAQHDSTSTVGKQ